MGDTLKLIKLLNGLRDLATGYSRMGREIESIKEAVQSNTVILKRMEFYMPRFCEDSTCTKHAAWRTATKQDSGKHAWCHIHKPSLKDVPDLEAINHPKLNTGEGEAPKP